MDRECAANHRRQWLQGLAMGGFAWWAAHVWPVAAQSVPPGIRQLKGDVRINGVVAQLGQAVLPGDEVTVGPEGEGVYVVGQDAYLLRGNSAVVHLQDGAKAALRLLRGRLLSVFGPGAKQIQTATATVGIRGTACYVEQAPEQVYFCLCYGTADIVPVADPAQQREIQTRYHDSPFVIGNKAGAGVLQPAPVINHTDAELIMLEALVGRRPPFMGISYLPRY
jgi:FecR protein